MRRVGAFYAKHAIGIDLVLITAGAAAVKRRLEDVHSRLDELEGGGMVPMDDVVTLRDLAKVEVALGSHQSALVDAGLLDPNVIDAEVVEEPEGAVGAGVGTEAPQEGQEGA